MAKASPTVDIHTHIYPPSYLSLLRSRSTPPKLLDLPDPNQPPRLIILPSDEDPSIPPESRGRPIDTSYSSIHEKLTFMTTHNISISIISLANPWLDFLPPDQGLSWSQKINNELQTICHESEKRLYAFATLPLSASPPSIVSEIHRLKTLPHIKGIILGTTGLGLGLDDQALNPIWRALEETSYLIFLHPHYGLPSSVYGPRGGTDYGHVLPLALGFPMETTIAFTRCFLSGVFDRYPDLKILIAHAGGTVPFLAGRIESCIQHERHFPAHEDGQRGPKRPFKTVMRENVWLDAVIYDGLGVKAAVEMVGEQRVLFGTDHPFFPPLKEEEGEGGWKSVRINVEAVDGAGGSGREGIMGGNAVGLLGLEVPD